MDRAFFIRSVSQLYMKHAFRVMTITYLPSLCPDACTLPVTTVIFQPDSQKSSLYLEFCFLMGEFSCLYRSEKVRTYSFISTAHVWSLKEINLRLLVASVELSFILHL